MNNAIPNSKSPTVHVSALMSIPRLCFTDNMFCALPIFSSLKVKLFRDSGAYWEQSLSRLMEEKVNTNDYLITVDYDSVFTREQVIRLLELAISHNADAMFAMQMKRESDRAILVVKPDQIGMDGRIDTYPDVSPARVGHFGLTVIKCEALRAMPKPWLWSVPNPDNGSWSHGPTGEKTDADIYFWKMAEHLGWKVMQANAVRIGHIQRVVTWPTREMGVIHQYINEWQAEGPPPEVLAESITAEPNAYTDAPLLTSRMDEPLVLMGPIPCG